MPLTSIIIPLHNRASELPQTLDSLLAQASREWEAIVVDDHSTDGADAVARDFASRDSRIKAHALPDTKRGAPAARNFGVTKATGDFVIFLDSDDLLSPTCVARRAAYLTAHADLDFAVSRSGIFREQPGDTPFLWNADTGEPDLDRLLQMDVPWATAGPIWRQSSLTKLAVDPSEPDELWNESVLSGQDWEFHLRAVASGLKYDRVEEIDCFWRMAGASRDSIGKSSFSEVHARARPAVIAKMYDFIRARGVMTDARRSAFAAMYFGAAETLATRVSRKEGRRAWRATGPLKLLDRNYYKKVDRYLFALRWPALAARLRLGIERDFPRELLPRRGRFFNTAPADPQRPPTLSVVMSAYNNVSYVTAAVKSILTQSFRDFEFIIIDDGSTDGTGDLLRRFAESDSRIRLVQRPNKGLTESLNEGLAMARGEFVARMDSDDIADRSRFDVQLKHLADHPEIVALGTRIETIDPFDSPLDRPLHHLEHEKIDAELMRGSGWALVHPTVIFRNDALKRVGGYRPELNLSEDLDLFIRLAEIGRVANLPDVLLKYRQHPKSINSLNYEGQLKLKRSIVEAAHTRRGTAIPAEWQFKDPRVTDPIAQHLFWGWKAHGLGNFEAAQKHAMAILKRKPLTIAAAKLLVVAYRDARRSSQRRPPLAPSMPEPAAAPARS